MPEPFITVYTPDSSLRNPSRMLRRMFRDLWNRRRQGACLLGSRLDDAKGGDVDLLLEIQEPVTDPAPLAARFAAQIFRVMRGQKVDALLAAPNLARLPIQEVVYWEGCPV